MPVTCVLEDNLIVPSEDGLIISSPQSSQRVLLPVVSQKNVQSVKEGKNNGSGDKQVEEKLQIQPDDWFICATGSLKRDKLVAVADAHKRLFIYELPNIDSPLFQCTTERKVTHLIFTSDGQKLLILDRTGDVFIWKFRDSSQSQPSLLLGHLSVVLDIRLTSLDKYIVTCDRDEKIRVSNFPNSYNIHTYCLGHKEFVSSICPIDNERLVSGSGDKTIRLWDTKNGKQLACHECTFPVKQLLLVDSFLLVTYFCQRTCQLIQVTKEDELIPVHQVEIDYDVLEMHPWTNEQVVLITNSSKTPIVFGQLRERTFTLIDNCAVWVQECVENLQRVMQVMPQDEMQLKFRQKSLEV